MSENVETVPEYLSLLLVSYGFVKVLQVNKCFPFNIELTSCCR